MCSFQSMWERLSRTLRTQRILALQVCDLETVLTIERARAEEAEKATARAERRLKQAVKEARCICYMYAISHCPDSIKRPSDVPPSFSSKDALCSQARVTWMMISASVKCAIQGLRDALKLAP